MPQIYRIRSLIWFSRRSFWYFHHPHLPIKFTTPNFRPTFTNLNFQFFSLPVEECFGKDWRICGRLVIITKD
ncbi:unnamed protein product [Citrullus colocynthis]|uniref:Uncharacterized protein n=1 Tax=Citrullus colocynthis TaxID=252529 RepID=A0ABP0YUP4_9ROSI